MQEGSARSALIVAVEPANAADGLRATLPFLGGTLVEHQARQAIAAGAGHVVVLVATMPPALLRGLDRLRRGGLSLDVARSLADAADRLHPDEPVLLIGDGCIADQRVLARIAAAPAVALLVRAASQPLTFERIDAAHGWGGLAMVDGALVRRAAAAPGDWDAQSTLLRRAVQAGATRIEAEPAPRALRTAADGASIVAALVEGSRAREGAWPARWLFPLVDGPAAGLLAHRAVDPLILAAAAAALACAAAVLACGALAGPALAAFLASGAVMAVARRLARARLVAVRGLRWWQAARDLSGAVALVSTAARVGTWGWLLAAGIALAAMIAAARERRPLARRGIAPPAAAADADALGWAALAGWIGFGWPGAVAVATGYALASFALIQERVLRTI